MPDRRGDLLTRFRRADPRALREDRASRCRWTTPNDATGRTVTGRQPWTGTRASRCVTHDRWSLGQVEVSMLTRWSELSERTQADHRRCHRRDDSQGGHARRHPAPTGKSDPRVQADLGGHCARQLGWDRATGVLRLRPPTRQPGLIWSTAAVRVRFAARRDGPVHPSPPGRFRRGTGARPWAAPWARTPHRTPG
jgi:hypothetical protein